MQATERESSQDRDLGARHHHSLSNSKSLIPMWDSADPARAPPPLPLNPGPGSPVTRANASATVQAAVAALAEKSQENTPSPYTTNPMPLSSSPEKSLIKGQYHKRMQSLQNVTNNSDFAAYLERRASPDKVSRTSPFEGPNRSNEKSPTKSDGPTTPNRGSPTLRPSSRYLSKPILGENTPPSATMLALQNMKIPLDLESPPIHTPATPPLAEKKTKPFDNLEGLSAQIGSLTAIATALQQEMNQLSRRSKDNATDLVSLKAATNARDEDIRKSLKELTANLTSKMFEPEATTPRGTPYIHPATGGFMIDRNLDTSPSSRKSFNANLPRMPSPSIFAAALERDITTSPGAISTDGSASIALLEKVLREMATKEGQEKLLTLMEDVKARPNEKDSDNSMPKMLEEILNLVKENSGSRALVRIRGNPPTPDFGETSQSPGPNYENQRSGAMIYDMSDDSVPRPQPLSLNHSKQVALQSANPLSEEVLAILKRVKNSVAEGGGLTSEVKALVRELRGEVLGMGRELARKLEEVDANRQSDSGPPTGPGKEEIEHIVEGALGELRQHMEHLIRDNRRRSSSSLASRSTVDTQEVYMAVRKALDETQLPQPSAPQDPESVLQKEDILEAVREAWESYKPEIELQNFGLERDEILECLAEGLRDYQTPKESAQPEVIYQQVLDAVHQGLEKFSPPRIEPDTSITREEIVTTVRDCLENFEWPIHPGMLEKEEGINRDDVLSAVKEGLASHEAPPQEIEINREDIFEAVRIGFHDASGTLSNNVGEHIVEHLHGMILEMKDEFKEYSAANGRDTEQVLDALKDGLEVLRGQIECFVERPVEAAGKEEILESVKDGFQLLQSDMEKFIVEAAQKDPSDTVDIIDTVKDGFRLLQSDIEKFVVESGQKDPSDTVEIIDTVKDGFRQLQSDMEKCITESVQKDPSDTAEIIDTVKDGFRLLQSDMVKCMAESGRKDPSDTVEMLDALEKEFEHLRQTLSTLLVRNNVSGDKDEILDAIRDITESDKMKGDSQQLAQMVQQELEHLRETLSTALVRPDTSLDKEEIIAAVKHNVEEIFEDYIRRKDGNESTISNTNELLDAFHDGVEVLRSDLEKVLSKERDSSLVDESLESLKEGLAGVQSEIHRLHAYQKELDEANAARGKELMLASESGFGNGIDGLKALVTQLQVKVEAIDLNPVLPESQSDVAKKDDLLEVLDAIKEVQGTVMEAGTREAPGENVASKDDIMSLDSLLQGLKSQLDELLPSASASWVTAEKVEGLETLTKEIKESLGLVATHMEIEGPSKEDVTSLETIMKDIWAAVEDLKSNQATESEDADKVVKGDVQNLETLIFEVKTTIEELVLPDINTLPTKEDVEALTHLVNEFKEKTEAENSLTAQAFEARKIEHGGLAEKLEEAKMFIAELKDEFKSKIGDSEGSILDLKTMLECLNDSADSFAKADNLKELAELVKRESERSHGDREAEKMEGEERELTLLAKIDDSHGALTTEIGKQIEEKFQELIGKYEEAQVIVESKFAATEERDLHNLDTLTSTKAVAEELKAVTIGMEAAVKEACDRMNDDAKTFFGRVDESFIKVDDLQVEVKAQHETIRDQLDRAAAATVRLESQMSNSHPELLNCIREVLSIVGQHYEHSQKSAEEFKSDLYALPAAIPPLLPALPAPPSPTIPKEIPVFEKFDDGLLHEKLDSLMEQASNTEKSATHILDEMQEQIKNTAREVSELVAKQSRAAIKESEDRQREDMETALALEKRLAQRERVESEIVNLEEEKRNLMQSIREMRQEQADLTKQSRRLIKEVAGMETALRIRQEEVHIMEDRAEDLERRIVEGLLDHARSQIVSRTSASDRMSLKRVSSSASNSTQRTVTSVATKEGSALGSGVGMALKRRIPLRASGSSISNLSNPRKERRIFSLTNVSGKRGAGDRHSTNPIGSSGGLTNLKRSQSVKAQTVMRRQSWDTRQSSSNKENEAFAEEEEHLSEAESDTGTERRTSYTGTYADSVSYGTGSTLSTDRRTSYGSTNGVLSAESGSYIEPSEDGNYSHDDTSSVSDATERSIDDNATEVIGHSEIHEDSEQEDPTDDEVVLYQHTDSGFGSELQNATADKALEIR
ncbi:hypothetical protein FQN57_000011 [Myotisia sp. PD_48]|nr:hypothetical protein FQN57_000011 [Myotisia sp. PD_48]